MNTKQFVVLFSAFATSSATFVVNGLAASLPLASAASGTLAFPLAFLGFLKLAAAASLGLGLGATSFLPQIREGGFFRSKRSAVEEAESTDAVFALVSSMDLLSCGKSLVCGLQARDPAALADDEKLILTLFADRKAKKMINPISPKAEYDLASDLGLAARNEVVCRKRYSTCPYTADEMMNALRSSRL